MNEPYNKGFAAAKEQWKTGKIWYIAYKRECTNAGEYAYIRGWNDFIETEAQIVEAAIATAWNNYFDADDKQIETASK